MKRKMLSLVALVVAAAVTVTPLAAQNLTFFAGGGAAIGSGDLSEDTGTGWIGFAGAGVPITSVPGASIGLTGFYAHIPYDGDADDATNIPGLFADLAYLLGATSSNPIKPYIRFGVGVMQHRYDPGTGTYDDESETKAGGSIGAGLNYVMASVTPFVGAHFVTGGSDTQFIAVYGGIAFGGRSSAAAQKAKLARR